MQGEGCNLSDRRMASLAICKLFSIEKDCCEKSFFLSFISVFKISAPFSSSTSMIEVGDLHREAIAGPACTRANNKISKKAIFFIRAANFGHAYNPSNNELFENCQFFFSLIYRSLERSGK